MKPSIELTRWARLGLVATTIVMAVALVIGAWLNHRGIVAAVATLNRGQADLLDAALREVTHPGGTEIDAEKLSGFLAAHDAAGLRFVGVVDAAGRVEMSAGEPALPLTAGERPDPRGGMAPLLIRAGSRVRAFFPRPPTRPEGAAGSPDREPPPGARGAPPPGARSTPPPTSHYNVFEFEPVAAGLVTRAQGALTLATIGAAILTLSALLFAWTSARYDAVRARLEEERRLTILGGMSAVLAHEIRNPLASLKGHAQLLVERLPEGSSERRKAERVVDESTRLEALTADLLDFVRTGPLDLKPVDPTALLREAAGQVTETAVDVGGDESPHHWLLDERRFRDAVLVNLLRNAVQASPATRPPEARASLENGNLVFTVTDFGPGLPEESAERIFDPFFTTRATGTGLGLPVARRIVEMHGGRIVAKSGPAGGTTFRVVLPRTEG